jgi:hypothetical protein
MPDTLQAFPFRCPHCDAHYFVIRTEAPDIGDDPEMTCMNCSGWLESREGVFCLKYIPVEDPTDGILTGGNVVETS